MKNRQTLLITVLLLISLALGAAQIILLLRGDTLSDYTSALWTLVYLLLTILWAVEDADRRHFNRPFDFDFLMYIFWPVAFPYYLIKTRGFFGLLSLLGFVLIWCGPWLAGLVAQTYIQ